MKYRDTYRIVTQVSRYVSHRDFRYRATPKIECDETASRENISPVASKHGSACNADDRAFLQSVPCRLSDSPLVRRPIGPKTHWSDGSLVRKPIGPKTHWSEKVSLVRKPLVRKSVIVTKHFSCRVVFFPAVFSAVWQTCLVDAAKNADVFAESIRCSKRDTSDSQRKRQRTGLGPPNFRSIRLGPNPNPNFRRRPNPNPNPNPRRTLTLTLPEVGWARIRHKSPKGNRNTT